MAIAGRGWKARIPRLIEGAAAWGASRKVLLIVALAALLLISEIVLRAASLAGAPLAFDIGPSTAFFYIKGSSHGMEHRPITARWCGHRCIFELPLEAEPADGRLILYVAALKTTPVDVHVRAAGQTLAELTLEPSRWTLRAWARAASNGKAFADLRKIEVPLRWPGGPARIELAMPHYPSGFTLVVDWIRLEGPRWVLPLRAWPLRVLLAGIFLILVFAGFSRWRAFIAGLIVAAGQGVLFGFHPFAAAHVAASLVGPVLVLGALVAGALRHRAGGRWVTAAFLASYLLKGAGLFHPSAFYPDTRNHARYLIAFDKAGGTLAERGRRAQFVTKTAYPRQVAGQMHAMPYSPMFYLPFTVMPMKAEAIGIVMKHVALAAAAAEVIVVFVLARTVFGPGSGVAAAGVAAFLPPLFSRLLLSVWPTIVGHVFDVIAIIAAARLVARPESLARAAAFAAALLAALLAYVGSLFNLSAFVVWLALLQRRAALRLLGIWALSVVLVCLLLYLPFLRVFFDDILPVWMKGGAPVQGSEASLLSGFGRAWRRLPLFYGYLYPALAVAAIVLARRRVRPESFAVLAAYAAAFVSLVLLRGLSGGLFQDVKETTFVAPFIAVTAGYTLEELAARGRAGRVTAAVLAAALAAFGLYKYAGYLDGALVWAE